jgi:hypothetical protein
MSDNELVGKMTKMILDLQTRLDDSQKRHTLAKFQMEIMEAFIREKYMMEFADWRKNNLQNDYDKKVSDLMTNHKSSPIWLNEYTPSREQIHVSLDWLKRGSE